jgi:hypothetical protein
MPTGFGRSVGATEPLGLAQDPHLDLGSIARVTTVKRTRAGRVESTVGCRYHPAS